MTVMRFVKSASLLVLCGVLAVCSLSAFDKPQVSASAIETSGTMNEGVAQATFKVVVTNGETSTMTHFYVIFEDGASVSLGDVDAGKSAVSESVTRTVNTAAMESRNSPLAVTLKFALDGATHELPAKLTLGGK